MKRHGSGGAGDRRRTLERVLAAADKLRSEINDATQRARDMASKEPEAEDIGVLLELLRGAPELIDRVERLPAVLTAAAAIVAIELQTSDAIGLRGLLANSYADNGTTAAHVRALGGILAEAYGRQPDEPRTIIQGSTPS